jgi:hypothetical protein
LNIESRNEALEVFVSRQLISGSPLAYDDAGRPR